MKGLLEGFYRAVYGQRRVVALLIYAAITAMSYLTAFFLRFDLHLPVEYGPTVALTLPVLLVIRVLTKRAFRLSRERWRHVGTRDLVKLVTATTVGTALFWLVLGFLPTVPNVPRSVILLEWGLTIFGIAGAWVSYRLFYEHIRRGGLGGKDGDRQRTLVIGAGVAGSRLAREMLRDGGHYEPVAFVDEDPLKWGTTLNGVEVVGSVADLDRITAEFDIEELIIAVPSAELVDLRRIISACMATGLPYKVLPSISDVLMSSEVRLSQLREVRIEDLLGRDPVELSLPELLADLTGRTVLVTGAAGSIGSELSRQLAANGPRCLVLLEQNESELYFLDLELQKAFPEVETVPVVGDILDTKALDQVFEEYRPERVYHAAAYKHVPLMEANARAAVKNNVLGTHKVIEAAGAHGCGRLVLISTDKAVRPCNVMGATKRSAERLVLDAAERYPDTWFTAVRFGNVLGSRGSVLPLFERQLEKGEPLTVTHRDVTRYFMTIPEAVQLVLQASVLPEARGRVAMLEMGEPVRILDLAMNLLRLSGYREGVDAHIVFTGLRPGEKLHEELVAPTEGTVPTDADKIRVIVDEEPVDSPRFELALSRLVRNIDDLSTEECLAILDEMVEGYSSGVSTTISGGIGAAD